MDNPATRDLLSMLPLTLTFEDFEGSEKIVHLGTFDASLEQLEALEGGEVAVKAVE